MPRTYAVTLTDEQLTNLRAALSTAQVRYYERLRAAQESDDAERAAFYEGWKHRVQDLLTLLDEAKRKGS